MSSPSTTLAMVAAASLATLASGHGCMSDPAVTFTITGDTTQYIATIESSASGFSGTFSSDPATNTASFTTAFASSEYSSLKELIEDLGQVVSSDATLTCGYTDPDETAQALPETYVLWAHSDSEGFTASHEGPCEIWCDDTRVFQDDDCPADYTTAPAQLPYDRDACLGSNDDVDGCHFVLRCWLDLNLNHVYVYDDDHELSFDNRLDCFDDDHVDNDNDGPFDDDGFFYDLDHDDVDNDGAFDCDSRIDVGVVELELSVHGSVASGQTNSTGTGTTGSGWGGSSTTTTTGTEATGSSNAGNTNGGNNNNNQGDTWTGGMSFGFNQ